MDGFGTGGALVVSVRMEQQVVLRYRGWCYGTVGGVGWSWYGWFCGWCWYGWCYGTVVGDGTGGAAGGVMVQWVALVRVKLRLVLLVVLQYSGWCWYGWSSGWCWYG